jgi:hypothetical protein
MQLFAVLIFFAIAMGFSIYCWAKHQGLLALISFAFWFMFVMYCFGAAIVQWDIYYGFGLLGCLMAFIMLITSLYYIIKNRPSLPGEDEEPPKVDYVTRILERKKQIDEAVRKRRGEY